MNSVYLLRMNIALVATIAARREWLESLHRSRSVNTLDSLKKTGFTTISMSC